MTSGNVSIPSDSGRWYVNNALFKLKWHQWEEGYSVFHTGSGETHTLDEISAQCLKLLETSPSNIPELSAKLATSLSLDLDDDLHEYVDKILQQFEYLGLVEKKRAPI